jgi:hypothetical protein
MFFTPPQMMLMAAAVDNNNKAKALQQSLTDIGAAGVTQAQMAQQTSRISELQNQIAELSATQKSTVELNAQLLLEIQRLNQAQQEMQEQHAEELRQRVVFEDKLRLYSAQLTTDGATPLEADRIAREEIQYEQELALAPEFAVQLNGLLNLPKVGLAATFASKNPRNWNTQKSATTPLPTQEKTQPTEPLYPSADVKKAVEELLHSLKTASEPRFRPDLLATARQSCILALQNGLASSIQATHLGVRQQMQALLTHLNANTENLLASPKGADAKLLEMRKSLETSCAALRDAVTLHGMLEELAVDQTVLPNLEPHVWDDRLSPLSTLTESNLLDFFALSVARSQKHWHHLRKGYGHFAHQQNVAGFILCSSLNNDGDAVADAFLIALENDTTQNAAEFLTHSAYLNLQASHRTQLRHLVTTNPIALRGLLNHCISNSDVSEVMHIANLTLSQETSSTSTLVVDEIKKFAYECVSNGRFTLARPVLNELVKQGDGTAVQSMIQHGESGDFTFITVCAGDSLVALAADFAWFVGIAYKRLGNVIKSDEYSTYALENASSAAILDSAQRIIDSRAGAAGITQLNELSKMSNDQPTRDSLRSFIDYLEGHEFLKDAQEEKARISFAKAAQQGMTPALVELGLLSISEEDWSSARSNFELADAQGSPAASIFLADLDFASAPQKAIVSWTEQLQESPELSLPRLIAIAASSGDSSQVKKLLSEPHTPVTPHLAVQQLWLHREGETVPDIMHLLSKVAAEPQMPYVRRLIGMEFFEQGYFYAARGQWMQAALNDDAEAVEYLLKMEMCLGRFQEAEAIGKFFIPRLLDSETFDEETMDHIETTYALYQSESGVLPYALEGWKEYSNCEALAHLIVHHEKFEGNKRLLKELRTYLAGMGLRPAKVTKARRNLEYAIDFATSLDPNATADNWYVGRCSAALAELRAVKMASS